VVTPAEDCVCHLAVVRVADRDAAAERLGAAGIATSVHYPVPDHRQPAWAADHGGVELPVTEEAARTILTVPCFPELRDDEVDHVCEALHDL
jgi:aminotransferase EvaB